MRSAHFVVCHGHRAYWCVGVDLFWDWRDEDEATREADLLSCLPRRARVAFGALLGEHRMQVYPDPERNFRVGGLFRLTLGNENARRPQADGRLDKVVAGERYARVSAVPLVLPLAGGVAAA